MKNIIFVRPQDKYYPSYWETFDSVAKEKKYLASVQRFPFESSVEFYRNIIDLGLPRLFAIDTETDRCIGWCDISSKGDSTGYLGTGILKEYRGRGIGTAMLSRVLQQAAEYGFSAVELGVLESNTRAIHVYEKLGFIHTGKRDKSHIWQHNMKSEDVLTMKKTLQKESKMKIMLKSPRMEDKEKVMDYRQEFISAGDHLHGTAMLGDYSTYEEWYADVIKNSCEETVAEGWVPATTLLAFNEEDLLVGMIDIRHRLNSYLAEFGGHIGYSVRPSQRRKGYAHIMLEKAMDICSTLGLSSVLLTCDKANIASAATIKSCGGVLENEVTEDGTVKQRYWIDVQKK